MSAVSVTSSQRAYLEAIRDHAEPDSGFAEVELQWSCSTNVPRYLEMCTAVRVFRALVRKGLAREQEGSGPMLTRAGEDVVGKMRHIDLGVAAT